MCVYVYDHACVCVCVCVYYHVCACVRVCVCMHTNMCMVWNVDVLDTCSSMFVLCLVLLNQLSETACSLTWMYELVQLRVNTTTLLQSLVIGSSEALFQRLEWMGFHVGQKLVERLVLWGLLCVDDVSSSSSSRASPQAPALSLLNS
jgi:hypothetical protein